MTSIFFLGTNLASVWLIIFLLCRNRRLKLTVDRKADILSLMFDDDEIDILKEHTGE